MGMDPVGVLGSVEKNPMMFNRYAYANNNPYKFVDPDGRSSLDIHGGMGFLARDLGTKWSGPKSAPKNPLRNLQTGSGNVAKLGVAVAVVGIVTLDPFIFGIGAKMSTAGTFVSGTSGIVADVTETGGLQLDTAADLLPTAANIITEQVLVAGKVPKPIAERAGMLVEAAATVMQGTSRRSSSSNEKVKDQ